MEFSEIFISLCEISHGLWKQKHDITCRAIISQNCRMWMNIFIPDSRVKMKSLNVNKIIYENERRQTVWRCASSVLDLWWKWIPFMIGFCYFASHSASLRFPSWSHPLHLLSYCKAISLLYKRNVAVIGKIVFKRHNSYQLIPFLSHSLVIIISSSHCHCLSHSLTPVSIQFMLGYARYVAAFWF